MKALVFEGIGNIQLKDVPDPQIQEPTDAIVGITACGICGTDLHMVRGTISMMEPGTVLGHEGVGVVEELGTEVRNLNLGDRVVIPSTIACGYCSYCRDGYYSQCDNANPQGKLAGTAYFGGPKMSGPFDGLQAERARIPFANVGLVKIPDNVTDQQAIFLSDIFPTGYFGAKLAEIKPGDTVAIFGCGPVGQMAVASAKLLGAGRIFAIDQVPSRLEMARAQGAEIIDFSKEDPVATILNLTGDIGVDRAIDAVGIDAERPHQGEAVKESNDNAEMFLQELQEIAPQITLQGDGWMKGDAPSQVHIWAVNSLAKAGTFAIIGVYPETDRFFPIGKAMNKNLTINMGNCNHRKYIPQLLDYIEQGVFDPSKILTQVEPITNILQAYKAFDKKESGWVKVELVPGI
ncbi:MAG: glutathione-dependent formaldehyde dehydrogenase [Candidatus Margulisiibacteriota bacterium]|nr:MAG: glutathione-dependent formaldehyde dehydrogenase [Candidatus Margulisbacteria bacterium GWD2_39_127]OGI01208.1 MAG: glutathione-dependent formaldehyde dehydrogenase [Candidatus Margulisbacteria bacterium GWF2_38_17]OGI09843.1 MAG: glutathione-dependent formaldehyde dehydrogenase [Candidatus Margulisbacteria bacterium GWE2_39_32]PZM78433.1 MAG: glutathione-dependent formaldehyde dehydrogenase [Candidatus Margulisiibacteriota bacterium]HAR64155.1 glutathione-dependent formaldehyde dehydro